MKAIPFKEANKILAEDQPQYENLPVFIEFKEIMVPNSNNDSSAMDKKLIPWQMTACFELSDEEIEEIVKTRKLWHTQMVLGNHFQPVLLSTKNPFKQ